jgi:hypothetical protein
VLEGGFEEGFLEEDAHREIYCGRKDIYYGF